MEPCGVQQVVVLQEAQTHTVGVAAHQVAAAVHDVLLGRFRTREQDQMQQQQHGPNQQ